MTTINVGDNYYDQQISKTYITSRNFNGTLSTTSASNELFPCDNLDKYYFDTLLYLHLFSSLYIALEAFQKTINYDVIKFTNAIKVLNIDINNSAQTFSDVFKIIQLNGNGTDASPYISVTFTFYLDNFKKSVIQTDSITTPTGYTSISSINLDQSIVTKMMPITYGLNSFNEVSGYTNIEAAGYTTYSTNGNSNIITYNSNVKSFTLSSITSGTEKTILEIILNLKQIVLKGNIDKPILARLKIQGPAIVTADLIDATEIKIINPSQYIATISDKSILEMEFKIEKGKNYKLSDLKSLEDPIDFLQIDSIFNPVTKVIYEIKEINRFSKSIKEKLILKKRGIIASDYCRSPFYTLDPLEVATVEEFMNEFKDYLS